MKEPTDLSIPSDAGIEPREDGRQYHKFTTLEKLWAVVDTPRGLLSKNGRLVILALLRREPNVFPSWDRLQENTDLSRATLADGLKEAELTGWLIVNHGVGVGSKYEIVIPQWINWIPAGQSIVFTYPGELPSDTRRELNAAGLPRKRKGSSAIEPPAEVLHKVLEPVQPLNYSSSAVELLPVQQLNSKKAIEEYKEDINAVEVNTSTASIDENQNPFAVSIPEVLSASGSEQESKSEGSSTAELPPVNTSLAGLATIVASHIAKSEDGLTSPEIQKRLNLSQPYVSQLLTAARKLNLVANHLDANGHAVRRVNGRAPVWYATDGKSEVVKYYESEQRARLRPAKQSKARPKETEVWLTSEEYERL